MPQRGTTMRVTATQAKNRLGAMCTQTNTGPVFVRKDGRIDTVILSADPFDTLNASVQGASILTTGNLPNFESFTPGGRGLAAPAVIRSDQRLSVRLRTARPRAVDSSGLPLTM